MFSSKCMNLKLTVRNPELGSIATQTNLIWLPFTKRTFSKAEFVKLSPHAVGRQAETVYRCRRQDESVVDHKAAPLALFYFSE